MSNPNIRVWANGLKGFEASHGRTPLSSTLTILCEVPPHLDMSDHPKSLPLSSDLAYETSLLFWRMVTSIFFREIRPRGAFHIPRDGPVIFVAAPHHNQVRYLHKHYQIRLRLSSHSSSIRSFSHCKYTVKPAGKHNSLLLQRA